MSDYDKIPLRTQQKLSTFASIKNGKQYLFDKELQYFSFAASIDQLNEQTEIADLGSSGLERLPKQLFRCKRLKVLLLEGNKLKNLPSKLNLFSSLEKLDVSNNRITHLPVDLFYLPSLKWLNLNYNKIADDFNQQYYDLPSPKQFSIKAFNASVSTKDLPREEMVVVPATAGGIIQLLSKSAEQKDYLTSTTNTPTYQIARQNKLQKASRDQSFATTTYPSQLQYLNISNNALTRIPEEVAAMPHITTLHFKNNRIQSLPNWLCQKKTLMHFSIGGNLIRVLSDDFCQLTNLESLDLSYIGFQQFPSLFDSLKKLSVLNLEGNHLSQIPTTLFKLKKLKKLNLSNNSIRTLPDLLVKLPLESLRLDYNFIQELPNTIGQLGQLTYLDLQHNELEKLPISLLKLARLQVIKLRGNLLSPAEVGKLEWVFPSAKIDC